jgi:hypothetical protein
MWVAAILVLAFGAGLIPLAQAQGETMGEQLTADNLLISNAASGSLSVKTNNVETAVMMSVQLGMLGLHVMHHTMMT